MGKKSNNGGGRKVRDKTKGKGASDGKKIKKETLEISEGKIKFGWMSEQDKSQVRGGETSGRGEEEREGDR